MARHPIPEAALTDTGAIIGRVGSGKTYTAKGIVERLLAQQQRVCIIDPTGVWWGLRSSADGKSPAFPIVVFGGDHADVQIAESSGAALATLLAGQNLPAIVDVSEFTVGGRTRLMTAFFDTLYQANRSPLSLVLDEADMFAPQRPMPDQNVMLSRVEQIVRRGRVRGFRPWLITQRPAELHKSVLSQANTLVAMQLTSPQDRDAVGAWIEGQADRDEGKRVLADLPKLKKGEGWVWSPSHDLLERVRFPAITTFDSSQTPQHGQAAPRVELAAVDLSAVSETLKAVEAERAENDPKALRAEIARLTELANLRATSLDEPDPAALQAARDEGEAEAMRKCARLLADVERAAAGIGRGTDDLRGTVDAMQSAIETYLAQPAPELTDTLRQIAPGIRAKRESTYAVAPAPGTPPILVRQVPKAAGGMDKAQRAFLTALAQQGRALTRNQVAIFAGYSATSRHVDNKLAGLRSSGWAEGGRDAITITPAGRKALGPYDKLPTGAELRRYWMAQLDKAGAEFLRVLCEAYPKALARDEVATRAGYSPTSRHVDNTLAQLRSRDLAHGGRAAIRASDNLFK